MLLMFQQMQMYVAITFPNPSTLPMMMMPSVNQGIKYYFHELVKATRCLIPLVTYYITFTAKEKEATHVDLDPSNCPATTFQAQVQTWYQERLMSNHVPLKPLINTCTTLA